MAFLPVWVVIGSAGVAGLIIIFLILYACSSSRRRALARTGLRYALRSPGRMIAQALPIALLVAIIFASLSVGDGLIEMVNETTDANLSNTDILLEAPRFFPQAAWERSGADATGYIRAAAPMLRFSSTAAKADTQYQPPSGSSIEIGVQFIGVDARIHALAPIYPAKNGDRINSLPSGDHGYINAKLAELLAVEPGERIRVRTDPATIAERSLLGYQGTEDIIFTIEIDAIIADRGLGRYREDSVDKIRPTVIIDLAWLQERVGLEGMVNAYLIDLDPSHFTGAPLDTAISELKTRLDRVLSGQDQGFTLTLTGSAGGWLVWNDDYFFPVADMDQELQMGAETLSYFVDTIGSAAANLSYSVVTGIETEPLSGIGTAGFDPFVTTDAEPLTLSLEPDEIAINNWTAEILEVGIGDTVEIQYRLVSNFGLFVNSSAVFRVKTIIAISGAGAERGFIPPIAGITDIASCADWEPAFDIDLASITGDDLAYWEEYRTTPKGFISIDTARELWANNYGDTTALWFPANARSGSDIGGMLNDSVTVTSMGASIVQVNSNARASSRGMLIFPGMFLTFGTVIIISALLTLAGVLRDLSLKRLKDWGILKAMGIPTSKIGLVGFFEAFPAMGIGAGLGIAFGAGLGYAINRGLNTSWAVTVEHSTVPLVFAGPTIVVAVAMGTLICLVLVIINIFKEARKTPAATIREAPAFVSDRTRARWVMIGAGSALTITGMIVLVLGTQNETGMALAGYFTAGGGLCSTGVSILLYLSVASVSDRSDRALIVSSNLARRAPRNALVIAIIALTLTMAIALSAIGNILVSDLDTTAATYGGGYDLLIETATPFEGDLSVLERALEGRFRITPVLAIGAEGGKCSNINAPYPPRLLGVPGGFYRNATFGILTRDTRFGSDAQAWVALDERIDGRIPIMVDQNTLEWIYFKGLGAVFSLTTENGEVAELVVIGILAPSVLTGSFVMSDGHLEALFPTAAGYTMFLVDQTGARSDDAAPEPAEELGAAFASFGPTVTTVRALAEENLDAEVSYIQLFRDFLIFGIVTAFGSAAVFTHARAVTIKSELEVLRTLGIKKRRAVGYFVAENSTVFLLAAAGAVIGTVLATITTYPVSEAAVVTVEFLVGVLVIVVPIVAISFLVAGLSAVWGLRDYRRLTRWGE